MLQILPEWYPKARKKLEDAIDDIVRENNIDWHFSHDSEALNNAKETILNVLMKVKEEVHNPYMVSDEDLKVLLPIPFEIKEAKRRRKIKR